jgi:hypothetical protein
VGSIRWIDSEQDSSEESTFWQQINERMRLLLWSLASVSFTRCFCSLLGAQNSIPLGGLSCRHQTPSGFVRFSASWLRGTENIRAHENASG